MTPFSEAYLQRLSALHDDIRSALQDLPAAAAGWVPGPGMNSPAVLVVHLTGAERFWIGDVALQESSGRVRAAEFQQADMGLDALFQRLESSLAYARGGLTELTDGDLSRLRSAPGFDRSFTVSWALLHALEHTATHVGHIQLTCQLWPGGATDA